MKPSTLISSFFALCSLTVLLSAFHTSAPPVKVIYDASRDMKNMREIHACLTEFESDWGTYPNDTTAMALQRKNIHQAALLGRQTSNDYMRQLLIGGYTDKEENFHCAAMKGAYRSIDASGLNMLEAGECGYSYIPAASTIANPQRPVLAANLIHGSRRFHNDTDDMILRRDGTVVRDKEGESFFDPAHPYWEAPFPAIKWPLRF